MIWRLVFMPHQQTMKIPITIRTPEDVSMNFYYDTVTYSFYNPDGTHVSDELPTEIWKMAAEIVMEVMGYTRDGEIVVPVPDDVLAAIQRHK